MRRTTKKQRAENARLFNTSLCEYHKGAIVVERTASANPYIVKTKFLACNTYGTPVVIAESKSGITGCFLEYFNSIGYKGKQVEYFDEKFAEWICKEFNYTIYYKDGMVFVLNCE